jgi:chemotaxis response regulator CheB
MRLHPLPVVMVSTLTTKGASETLLALELGAVDFVAKPNAELSGGIDAFGENLGTRCAPRRTPMCTPDRSRRRHRTCRCAPPRRPRVP